MSKYRVKLYAINYVDIDAADEDEAQELAIDKLAESVPWDEVATEIIQSPA